MCLGNENRQAEVQAFGVKQCQTQQWRRAGKNDRRFNSADSRYTCERGKPLSQADEKESLLKHRILSTATT